MKYGFAFVEFSDIRDAEDACHDLNGKAMNSDTNLRCIVEIAKGRPRGSDEYRFTDRRGGSGRRRSRSRSPARRRRSRSRDRRRSPRRSRSPKRRSRSPKRPDSRDR